MNIEQMTIADYDELIQLWQGCDGIGLHLHDVDSRQGIDAYLYRNPGSSFVARDRGRLVGAVLCGHDGRRGYLHHLAVAPPHREHGIGRQLAGNALAALRSIGLRKCHLFVFNDNRPALHFWNRVGWCDRTDIILMSSSTDRWTAQSVSADKEKRQ